MHKVIYIMGVSGSGKSTIGKALAASICYAFYDGDDFHSAANKAKMNSGIPLTTEDRLPWLQAINTFIRQRLPETSIVFACSALKNEYRQILQAGIENKCTWVFLQGDHDIIAKRLAARSGHFMPAALLQSQFDGLEIPADAIMVNIDQPVPAIVAAIRQQL